MVALLVVPGTAVAAKTRAQPKPRADTGVITLAGGQSEIIYCATLGEHWNKTGFPLHDYCPRVGPPPTTTTVPVTTTLPVPTTVPTGVFRLFGANSLWNTVKAPTAGFAAAATPVLKSLTFYLNDGSWDHPFYVAKSSDPLTTFHLGAGWGHPAETITANAPAGMAQAGPPGGDDVMDVLLPDGTLLDMYGVTGGGTNWTAQVYGTSDGVNGPGFGTLPYTAIGTTAIGSPQAGGTILASDVAAGVIPHALSMACNYTYEGGVGTSGTPILAPAVSYDDGGGPGPLPQGGLLLIPAGTPMPGNLSTMGKALWNAAATEGVYVTDKTGAPCNFYGDGSAAVGNAFTQTDLNDIGRALQLVVTWIQAPKLRIQPFCPGPKSVVGCSG
jgi:hypothetical protein